EARARFAAPTPRLAEAAWLAAHGATAMIDISDGVVSEAAHLAAAGRVGIMLHLDRLPCVPTASMHDAAMSGEEYELLVTAPASVDAAAFAARFGLALTAIGEVGAVDAAAPAVRTLVRGSAVEVPRGHDHLSA
ncbi:MAG: hypothetical protein K2X99_10615, partial [Gemmatimonadaceae bacterium]|nr:hypothetical protein [Gemmatimonadaceae bacterium]